MTPLSALLHIREQLDRTDIPDPRTQLETISILVDKVLDDAELRVLRHATTNAKDPKNPPHYLRCNATQAHERCILGDGHSDAHKWRREVVA